MFKLTLATFAILLVVVASVSATIQHYYDHSVYRVRPSNVMQLSMLQKLVEDGDVDFWREPDQINRFADVMLRPDNKDKILKFFDDNLIAYNLIISDVEKIIERERNEQLAVDEQLKTRADARPHNEAVAGFWKKYQNFNSHANFVAKLEEQNPEIVQKVKFGSSHEKRPLVAALIGEKPNSSKKAIWIEGGIHAREWISPATVTYFAQQLVNLYNEKDPTVQDLLKYYDFYIVPVLNADGYEYSHTNDRLWRKTRRPSTSKPTCIGADPNRNFGYQWGGTGASTNPCSETYRGDSAFSEPETRAESDYILNNLKGRLASFIAVHSYGQYWLYPWGWTSAVTKDDAKLNKVAKAAVAALNKVSMSTKFTIGTSTNVLYAAAGGSDDWAYGSANCTYSYTVELRDTGYYGFQLPASLILPTATETTAAFLELASSIKSAK